MITEVIKVNSLLKLQSKCMSFVTSTSVQTKQMIDDYKVSHTKITKLKIIEQTLILVIFRTLILNKSDVEDLYNATL